MAQNIKVIHVHFLTSHKNSYFGSVKAIFRHFSEADIGCTEKYLSHILKGDGSHHLTSRALILRSHLIRG